MARYGPKVHDLQIQICRAVTLIIDATEIAREAAALGNMTQADVAMSAVKKASEAFVNGAFLLEQMTGIDERIWREEATSYAWTGAVVAEAEAIVEAAANPS